MSEVRFCPLCDVTLDLHDGPDSCHSAEMKARLLESFGQMSFPAPVVQQQGGE